MSIPSLGIIGSLTTGQLQQTRSSDAERATQAAKNQANSVDAVEKAEAAAGLGEMTEDQGASERDADGRRLWEPPAHAPREEGSGGDATSAGSDEPPRGLDPTGTAGQGLDLTG